MPRRTTGRTVSRRPLRLELLEGRAVPAVVNWTLGANGDFANPLAWTDASNGSHHVPGAADDAAIPAPFAVTSAADQVVHGLTAGGFEVLGGTFTINSAFANAGTVSVDAGTLAINGTYTQSAGLTTVAGGAVQLWKDGREGVAALVLFTAIVAPALQIGFMLAIAISARGERAPGWGRTLMRHHPTTCTWSMIEVMMLGVLVALIKIADYATVIPGLAMFTLGALIFLLAAIQAIFDPRLVWERVPWASDEARRTAEHPIAGTTS